MFFLLYSAGDLFDIKVFHWEVMRLGFVPLRLLDDSIDRWISGLLSNSSGAVYISQSVMALSVVMAMAYNVLLNARVGLFGI